MSGLIPILEQFQLGGKVLTVEPFGSGNINDTYRSTVQGQARQYVHQKINATVFHHPEQVMENMACVTRHIHKKFASQPIARRRITLDIVPTRDGKLYYQDVDGNYWRTTVCIPNIIAYNTIQSSAHAFEVGRTLGEFQRLVSDIPASNLHDTLPGFHYTPNYYDELVAAFDTSRANTEIDRRRHESSVVELYEHIQRRQDLLPLLMEAFQAGKLQERVVHNDPKVNNILLDADTHLGVGLIDLDTVKSGLIQFDYGDALRTGANPAGEETRDHTQVRFDLGVFECFTKGYLGEAGAFLSPTDIALLVDAIKLIILEQTIRFLADYVNGDVYYHKIDYPTQNLNRAQVQMTLLMDLERKEAEARRILNTLRA